MPQQGFDLCIKVPQSNIGQHLIAQVVGGAMLSLEHPFRVVYDTLTLRYVHLLWRKVYQHIYPNLLIEEDDPYDEHSFVLYTQDSKGEITSSARLVIDGSMGLPEDPYFPPEIQQYRLSGKKLIEFGRFIKPEKNLRLLKLYYQAIYKIAVAVKADMIIMAMKPHHVGFHKKMLGAKEIAPMDLTYGGSEKLSCVVWNIQETGARFFKWVKVHKQQGS